MVSKFGFKWVSLYRRLYFAVLPKQERGFEQRRQLYQLYHYLNHYNLFGVGLHEAIAVDPLLALKAPGFNPLAYEVKNWFSNILLISKSTTCTAYFGGGYRGQCVDIMKRLVR
jgi:hypothetical protein